ncbi:MAG: NAD+ synthase [Rhodospirillales bacterium]|nr:NAD+ synthase [Rhodospirillales bacterium]
MTTPLSITLSQINPIVGDMPYNLDKIRRVRDEMSAQTDLIVFPELSVCGYPPEDLILKPFFLDKVESAVRALVSESEKNGPALLISAPWRIDGKTYNAALLIEGGAIKAVRAKHLLPNYGVFDELRVFTPGPLPDPVSFKGVNLGIMICEDMWSPDVAAHLKSRGAALLIVLNASPFEADKNDLRQEQARRRAQENALPLLYVNQCGGQDELVFDGASFVLDKDGRVLEQMVKFEESARTVFYPLASSPSDVPDEDPHKVLYTALVTGLRDYVSKNRFPGVIIGMSGGIDSALSAAIAVDALGPERVQCVMMPSKFTSQESLDDAENCAKALGASYEIISIESAVTAFENELASFLKDAPPVTHENIQPRCRGLILMALSNASGRMVLSTGNKSEMAVGYATLYGDMCGGFNVLKDVYKVQVYELSRWRNTQSPVIPESIITKKPTAELKPDQCDQDTLPPYEELDDILHCLIELDLGVDGIVARGHAPETVRRVWRMLDLAEYKRRQAPPGVKVTSRAFGRDRRYPITNHFVNIIEKA